MTELTDTMKWVLEDVRKRGIAFAGRNVVDGKAYDIRATVLRALELRGLVTISTSPDGGLMARPTTISA